jgi:lipopolysaccharide heptosyltransferase II
MKISANVVTFNEAANIDRCLKSLDFCDEIVVVDSNSTDGTIKAVKKHTNKIHTMQFTDFSAIKNRAIDLSRGEWILSVDADEEVTPALKARILEITGSKQAVDGYLIRRGNFFLGREIKHCGWDHDYQLRLFKRVKGRFDGRPVHESVKVDGATARIAEKLLHYSYPDSRSYFTKMNRYTSMQAAERQKPFLFLRMLTAPFMKFFRMYFVKLGFLDGLNGFILSSYSGFSEFVKFSKMLEARESRLGSRALVLRAPNWIGDAVMMTAYLKEIKRHYPKLIVAVSNNGVKAMLEGNPHIDRLVLYDRKSVLSTLKAAGEIRREHPGAGLSFSPSLSSYFLLLLTGAALRAGYASDMGRLLLNRAYKQDKSHKSGHIMEEYKKLLYLINNGFDFSASKQEIFTGKDDIYEIRNPKYAINILIAPFAKFGPSKMWPVAYYSELITMLLKKHGNAKVMVTGLEEDKSFDLGNDVMRHKNFVDLRGSGLKEVIAAAKSADYFVGNDSGVMHIADAFGVPMSVIFGSTAPGWGGPVNSRAEIFYGGLDCQPCFKKSCKYGHYNCLNMVKPGDVLKKTRF